MQNDIKKRVELDKLLKDISSPTASINLKKFEQISQTKYFVQNVKHLIKTKKHPKITLALLELIEYTTVKCNRPLHNEYNNIQFLQVIFSIFNSKTLVNDVKEKTLFLFQFWNNFFESQQDLFPNFSMLFKKIVDNGVTLPQQVNSKYQGNQTQKQNIEYSRNQSQPEISQKPMNPIPQNIQPQNQSYNQPQPQQQNNQSSFVNNMNPQAKKLFNDLQKVWEIIHQTNTLIDQRNPQYQNNLQKLNKFQNSLKVLPQKLQNSGQTFLHNYCVAIIQDVQQTFQRFQCIQNRSSIPPFQSSSQPLLVQQHHQENNIFELNIEQPQQVQMTNNTPQNNINQQQQSQVQQQFIQQPQVQQQLIQQPQVQQQFVQQPQQVFNQNNLVQQTNSNDFDDFDQPQNNVQNNQPIQQNQPLVQHNEDVYNELNINKVSQNSLEQQQQQYMNNIPQQQPLQQFQQQSFVNQTSQGSWQDQQNIINSQQNYPEQQQVYSQQSVENINQYSNPNSGNQINSNQNINQEIQEQDYSMDNDPFYQQPQQQIQNYDAFQHQEQNIQQQQQNIFQQSGNDPFKQANDPFENLANEMMTQGFNEPQNQVPQESIQQQNNDQFQENNLFGEDIQNIQLQNNMDPFGDFDNNQIQEQQQNIEKNVQNQPLQDQNPQKKENDLFSDFDNFQQI